MPRFYRGVWRHIALIGPIFKHNINNFRVNDSFVLHRESFGQVINNVIGNIYFYHSFLRVQQRYKKKRAQLKYI